MFTEILFCRVLYACDMRVSDICAFNLATFRLSRPYGENLRRRFLLRLWDIYGHKMKKAYETF